MTYSFYKILGVRKARRHTEPDITSSSSEEELPGMLITKAFTVLLYYYRIKTRYAKKKKILRFLTLKRIGCFSTKSYYFQIKKPIFLFLFYRYGFSLRGGHYL